MTFSAFMAVAHDHDAAYGFSFAIPLGHAFADIRTEADAPEITHQNRRAILAANGNVPEIVQ